MASALISSWPRPLALLTLALTLALVLGSLAACEDGVPKSTPGTDPQKEEPTATPYQNYCDGQTPIVTNRHPGEKVEKHAELAMKNRAGLASVTEDYVQRVSAVRLKYLDQLMSKPNVVGVAEGDGKKFLFQGRRRQLDRYGGPDRTHRPSPRGGGPEHAAGSRPDTGLSRRR